MNRLLAASPLVLFLVAACGGSPTPPPTTTPEPAPTVKEEPKPEPSASATPAASASAPAPEPAATAKKPTGSGRPQAIYNDVSEPQTVGFDGAVFRTADGAELRIPGGALSEPRNVIFSLDKKAKGTTGALGKVYQIHVQTPDTQYRMGEESPSVTVNTAGDPFVIKLPLPQGRDSAGLAIETVAVDPKTKRNKSTWTVVGQNKLETADTGNRGVFEVQVLPDGHVHLTSQAPSGG